MSIERTGWFVSIGVPSGVGESTTVQTLHDFLAEQGRLARRTVEPTTTLGTFTRSHANEIHGLALACLVAAARYEHVETVIAPALQAGELIVSDRYPPSTLVRQQLGGVPFEFLVDVNRHVPIPDLAAILTVKPGLITERIAERGITHCWHFDTSRQRCRSNARCCRTSSGAIHASGSRSARSSWARVAASTLSFFNRAEAIALQRSGWTRCGSKP